MATYRKIKRKKGYVHKVIWRDSWGKQCSKTMPTYKEAKDLQDLLENGGTLNPSMRVNELFQQYYAVKENVEKLRVTSLSELEQTWRVHLQPEIGNAKVGDVRPLDLLRVLTRVKNKSARCQLRMVTLLKALFRFAQDNELTIGNPANKLKRPKYGPSADELTIIGSGVLDNDTDAENDSLSAILDLPPSDGALVLGLDGSFQYIPNVDFIGSDSFSYHSNDGLDDGNTATVTINVIAVNDLPQAVNDEYSTDESTSLNVSAPGVLANDSDPENDTLDALLDSTTTDGVLVLNSDGSFEYTPNNDFVGTDSFSYHAFDGADNSNIATVTIEVNPNNSDSIIDSILEQIQMLFDKIFVIEDEVAELKEQNSSLEFRVAELEAMISSNPSHDHDNDNKDERKILKNEIKALN